MKSLTQFLGPICKQNHEFKNTGQSLRRLNGSPAGVCVECFDLYQERYRLGKKREIEIYLGPPCKHLHIEANGKTRRYVSTGNCVECQKKHSRNYYRKKRNEQNSENDLLTSRPTDDTARGRHAI